MNQLLDVAALIENHISDCQKILPVIEIYPCLQGEGSHRGIPTIAIRTTGCTHRCYFQGDSWCDSWYSSIHAEKGKYSFNDIIKVINQHPHINEIMLTGGSPTMHPQLLCALSIIAHNYKLKITLETEGSHFVETPYPLALISVSPKFSNTIPTIGELTPKGKPTTKKMIEQHNKYRLNYQAIKKMLSYHCDYQIKPVFDGNEQTLKEIIQFCQQLNIPYNKVFLMPHGQTRKTLIKAYSKTMETCLKFGFSFTGRDHIIAYGDKRYV
ncbi:7-carboxy-7-deazaguanine synthase QueE [Thiotrichales bacterium 19S3-7]|nr:7-carboxy-7-deazaguanine synthase QueE [Thiotrichales bacterium 19S3-7]MCF6802737.1 7-carboxy-7-deazaguanine synthase QueE [Thiotrichales bacterium 19S3-11]